MYIPLWCWPWQILGVESLKGTVIEKIILEHNNLEKQGVKFENNFRAALALSLWLSKWLFNGQAKKGLGKGQNKLIRSNNKLTITKNVIVSELILENVSPFNKKST